MINPEECSLLDLSLLSPNLEPPFNSKLTDSQLAITCRKCLKQYVGKSSKSLRQRHYGHRREIETESSALGQHFSQANCGPDSLTIQVIELVRPVENLLVREGFWQHELASFAPLGINIRDELGGKLKT